MQAYVVTGNGKLFVSGGTLAVYLADEDTTKRIPARTADALIITGKMSITSDVLTLASKNRIVMVYAPGHRIRAVITPTPLPASGRLHVAQARAFLENRVHVAKQIEKYGFQHATERYTRLPTDNAAKMATEAIESAESVQEIMGIEGTYYREYYKALDELLPQWLQVGGREYHPPPNPGNAVVSFANALLYGYLITVLVATGLDTSISYIHEPTHGPISLALDFAEMYRPAVLSRAFLSAASKYKLGRKDFIKTGTYQKFKK